MKLLQDMDTKELKEYRTTIQQQLKENQKRYDTRYSESNSDYAASINDDYNGEGEEFTQLTLLLGQIDCEINRRESDGSAHSSALDYP